MSQQIDNQIVKMQFDNASFEKNVQQTMSTLDKLKQALRFDKVNMTPLQQAFAETENTATKAGIHIRDIWLKMGNIIEDQVASKIVNTGKKIMNALSFEGINDGFSEYELKMGSIQTIMAGTGESLATVNRYLDELNTYSDKTIYSFADMTNNIGKFTNAGVKLEDAVAAIKGIANEAAVSGANANEASRAMYNFSQALSAGYVKLIDWKSIENANMATKEFKETLLTMGTACGTVKKQADGMYQVLTKNAQGSTMSELVSGTKNFNDSLAYQWMTTDVLTKALKVYATDIRELDDVEREAYETELRKMGLDDEQIKKFEELGIKATNAASEIKTFSMLMDTLKEAIGSGWAMSWQLMIGDFEQAKELWTNVGKEIGGVIDGLSESRNKFLKQGLQTGWEKLLGGGGLADVALDADKLRGIMIKLAKEQNVINKEQYDGIIDTQTFVKSLHESSWMTGSLLKEAVDDYVNIIKSMSESDRKDMGFDDATLAKLEEFNKAIQSSDEYADDLAQSMNELGGRENVIQGLANLFQTLKDTLKPIAEAFDDVFGVLDPSNLYNLTKSFKEFTEQLKVSEEGANTIKTSFTLAFGAIKTVLGAVITTIKGVTKLVLPLFNLFDAIFGMIGRVLSALTGSKGALDTADKFSKFGDKLSGKYLHAMQRLADLINKIADGIRGLPESTVFVKIHDAVEKTVETLQKFWEEFTSLPVIQQMVEDFWKTVDKIQQAFDKFSKKVEDNLGKIHASIKKYINWQTFNAGLTTVYTKIKDFITLVKNFAKRIEEFFRGLKEGKTVVESFRENFGDIIDKIKELKKHIEDFFHTLFENGEEMGKNFNLEEIAQAIHEFVSNITPDQIALIAVTTGFTLITINLLRLSDAMRNAVDSFTGIGVAMKNVINSYVKKQKSTILQVAEAIVVVAGALWVLSTIPEEKMTQAIRGIVAITVALTALMAGLAGVGFVMHKFGGDKSLVELASGLVIVAGALLVCVGALKALEYLNLDWMIIPKIMVLSVVMTALAGLSVLIGKLDKFGKGSLTFLAVAGALYLTATAMAKIGSIPDEQIEKSMSTILKLMIGLAALVAASSQVGIFSSIGFLSIIIMFDKLMPTIEKIVNYDYTKINNGLDKNQEMFKKLGGVLIIMTAIGAIAGKRLKGVGIGFAGIAGAFAIFVGVAKLAGQMNPAELKRGETFMIHMGILISLMELASMKSRLGIYGGKNSEGSKALIRIAIAMGIMLGIAKLASKMDPKDMVMGAVALAGLSALIGAMLWAANKAKNTEGVVKSIAGMLVSVSLILGMVGILSFINFDRMKYALGVVGAIIILLGGFALALGSTKKVIDKNTQGISSIAAEFIVALGAIIAITSIMAYMAKMPYENVLAAGVAVGIVIVALAKIVKNMSKLNGNFSWNSLIPVVSMLGIVLAVVGVMYAVTRLIGKYNIDPSKLVEVGNAMKTALTGVALCLAAMAMVGGQDLTWDNMGAATIGALALLIGVGTALWAVANATSNIDGDRLIKVSTALAIGLLGVALPIAAIGLVGRLTSAGDWPTMVTSIVGAIAALTAVSIAITQVANRVQNPENLMETAKALSLMMAVICVPIMFLSVLGTFCNGMGLVNMIGPVTGAVLALAGVAATLVWFSDNVDATKLESLNGSIPIICTALGGVAVLMLAVAAAGRIAGGPMQALAGGVVLAEAIAGFVVIVMALMGLGAVLNNLKGSQEALETGLDAFVLIIGKLGEALGNLISGFALGLTDNLSAIADNLNEFSEKIKQFMQNMDENANYKNALDGVGVFTDALLKLATIDLKNKDFKKLAKLDFTKLGKVMFDFAMSVKDISNDAVSKASICSAIVSRLVGVDWGIDSKSVKKFIEAVPGLGQSIKSFASEVQGMPETTIDDANRAKDAVTPIIELTKSLKREDGAVQWLIGEKDLGKFGENLGTFATGLKTMVEKLTAVEKHSENYPEMIKRCADAMPPLIDLAGSVENMGGLLAGVVGDNTLDLFGGTLVPFVDGLREFIAKLSYLASHEPNYKQLILDCVDATQALINMANTLENMGGVAAAFTGDNTLKEFGKRLYDFGYYLAKYVEEIADIDFQKVVDTNVIIKDLIDLGTLAEGVTAEAFDGLKAGLEYFKTVPISTIGQEIQQSTPQLIVIVTNMFNQLRDLTINRTTTDKEFYVKYGRSVGQGIIEGEKIERPIIIVELINLIEAIKNYLNIAMQPSLFEGYGYNVSLGVASGIRAGIGDAVAAAEEMAAAVAAVLPEAWQENSPSKLSYGFGKYYALGSANGIRDYTSEVVLAASEMSDEVIETAKDIITEISKVISSDVGTQPVIRPVLDTSDITAKAGKISKLFNASDLSLAYSASGAINRAYIDKAVVSTGDDQNGAATQQINFTQNNYSPKSLSRMEIYRQTKNQLSMMEGVVRANA